MRNTKLAVALSAAAALAAAPLMTATVASADVSGSNSGTSVTRGTAVKADTSLAKCKGVVKQPSKKYTKKTKLVDLSGIADFTPVSEAGGVTFTPTLEKRSVPASWGTWGSPPDTESATPNILYTAGAIEINVDLGKATGTGGFEIEPNPFEVHTFNATFAKGGKSVCTLTIDADGNAGAKLLAISGKKKFDNITVSSDVDFAIAQVRH